ncbi:MAG: hypothetical protein QOI95_3527 [Acidimicrobiaceae bacterium]|jgi:hypothetical protein
MRKIAVLTAAVAVAAAGVLGAVPAHADLVCASPGGPTVSACASADDSHGAITAGSSGQPVGGVVGVYGNSQGSGAALAQGNTNNPSPANGWVLVSGSSGGVNVACGTAGAPDPAATCP